MKAILLQIVLFIWRFIVFCFLTALTQVGGIVYIIHRLTYALFFPENAILSSWKKTSYRIFSFLFWYSLVSFIVVPPIAKAFGRVQLPLVETGHVKPLTVWTFILNRNYVTPELEKTVFDVAAKMELKYNNHITLYLDANFPFYNGFPLPPHLSHNDGKKLDLTFSYDDVLSNQPANDAPSYIGYGISEVPRPNEIDRPAECAAQGYKWYSFMQNTLPQSRKEKFIFNEKRTATLIQLFMAEKNIKKVLLEPHLVSRLKLNHKKLGLHACFAVRHDDHFHIEAIN